MNPSLPVDAQHLLAEYRRGSLLHADITEAIIGAFYTVYNTLGYGFVESVYTNALAIELRAMGLHVAREVPLEVWYRGVRVGYFRADIVVAHVVVLEIKATRSVDAGDRKQLHNYLRAGTRRVGLLLHFGPTPNFRRLVSPDRSPVRQEGDGREMNTDQQQDVSGAEDNGSLGSKDL